MKVIAAAALIASSFGPIALPPLVSAAAADPSNGNACNMPMSASSGWTCNSSSTSFYSHEELSGDPVGGDVRIICQDYESTGPSVGINPAGHAVGAFSSAGGDMPVGGPYDGTSSGCNYPVQ